MYLETPETIANSSNFEGDERVQDEILTPDSINVPMSQCFCEGSCTCKILCKRFASTAALSEVRMANLAGEVVSSLRSCLKKPKVDHSSSGLSVIFGECRIFKFDCDEPSTIYVEHSTDPVKAGDNFPSGHFDSPQPKGSNSLYISPSSDTMTQLRRQKRVESQCSSTKTVRRQRELKKKRSLNLSVVDNNIALEALALMPEDSSELTMHNFDQEAVSPVIDSGNYAETSLSAFTSLSFTAEDAFFD